MALNLKNIYRGMENGAEEIEANFKAVKTEMDNSAVYESDWIPIGTNGKIRCKRIGDILYVTFDNWKYIGTIAVGTLPNGWLPAFQQMKRVQGWSVQDKAELIQFESDGNVEKVSSFSDTNMCDTVIVVLKPL